MTPSATTFVLQPFAPAAVHGILKLLLVGGPLG
jgi:hypothetical protein